MPEAAVEQAAPAALPQSEADAPEALQESVPAAAILPPAPAKGPRVTLGDMSAWGMFTQAVPAVKFVMIGLVLASVLTWTIWVVKALELRQGRRRLKEALAALDAAPVLDELPAVSDPAVTVMVRVAQNEFGQCADLLRHGVSDGFKERVALRLQRIEAAASQRMTRGVGLLATIGSTAPFIGLFGTVWGIMHSFIGIAQAQTTNLAVVAPGIAEALLATALGLVAAIPAVVIYNIFTRQVASYRGLLADCSTLVMCLVSREIDFRAISMAERPRIVAGR